MSRFHRAFAVPASIVISLILIASCGGRDSGDDESGSSGGAATSTGVTEDTIKIGNIATLSGPLPGLFQGAVNGVRAYVEYVNAKGGVNGRKLEVVSEDDALNCNENTKATEQLMDETFALVGSFSVFDNCGAKVLEQNEGVPNVSYPLSAPAAALDNTFSPQPAPPGFRTGAFQYFKNEFGVSKVGMIVGDATASELIDWQVGAMEKVGLKVVYRRAAGSTETDFTADVIRMRDAGADYLYLGSFNVENIARIINSAAQQGWKPKVIDSIPAYDAKFLGLVDAKAAEGMFLPLPYAMFLGEDRATNPAVDTFLTELKKVDAKATPDLFALFGWASAELFVTALEAAGDDPTREGLFEALKSIDDFDASGLLPPAGVGDKEPPECWVLVQVRAGKFVRVLPEDKGFTCEPGGYEAAS